MRDVVAYVVRALVDDPERATIDEVDTARGVAYEIRAAPGDVGRLIGRGGRTVKALRQVVRSLADPDGPRVDVEVYGEDE